jgi:hypothetical protein
MRAAVLDLIPVERQYPTVVAHGRAQRGGAIGGGNRGGQMQSFARSERSVDDWRDWVLHVSDDQGDELFVVPFTFVLR